MGGRGFIKARQPPQPFLLVIPAKAGMTDAIYLNHHISFLCLVFRAAPFYFKVNSRKI
jgi:hypothetical protein